MSRSVVMRTIEELDDLFNIEQGIPKEMSGGGRRNGGCGGGVMVPYGSGLVSDPGRFGFNPYAQGFVPAMHGGRIAGGLRLNCRVSKKSGKQSKPSAWVQYIKFVATDENNPRLYNEVLADPQTAIAYRNLPEEHIAWLEQAKIPYSKDAILKAIQEKQEREGVQGSARRGRRNIYYY